MSEKQATDITEYTYPHNSGGEVSNESLANDFAAHPEEYHPALHRHIGTFLESHGYLREAIQRSEEDRARRQEVRTQRQLTAEEIYGQLKEDENVEFGNYQAKTFIAKFGIDDFRCNLHRFKELDESVLAQLADNGYILGISGCVQSFSPHLLPTIAELIINSRYGFKIAELLSEFPEDSALIGVVRENIDHVDSYAIYQFIDKFPEINQTNLVLRLINEGYGGHIARICDELPDIDKALLFECLVEEEDYVNIVTLRNFFGEEIMQQLVDKVGELEVNATFLKLDLPLPEGEDINAVLAMLIERRELSLAAHTMRRYEGIDQHILEKMIEQGRYDVLQYVSNVTSLNKRNLLVSALSAGTSAVYEVLSLGGFSEEDAKLLITEGYEDSILSSNDAFSELSDDIIETLFQICEPHVICASNLLRTRARPRWMYALLQSGFNLAAPRLRGSSAEDIVELQDMLEAAGDLGLLASSIHCLPPEVTERVIDRTLGDDLARGAILSRASLLDENARNTLLEKIAELGTTNALVDLLQYRRHFTRIPVDKDMATDLMASGHAAQVVDNLDLFPDVDPEAAMKLCFEEGHYSAFVRHLNLISSLSREQVELLEDHGYLSTLLTNVRLIDGQKRKDIIGAMLKEGRVSEIPVEVYRYIDGSMVLDVVEEYINDSADSFQIFRDIVLGLSPGKQPEGMRAAAKIFGNSFNQNCLQTVHDILNGGGSLPRSVNELGIYASGQEGLEQLRLKIGDFVSRLRDIHLDTDTENKIMSNPLYFEAFKGVIKYDTSEHLYNMTDDNLRRRISNALTAIHSDNFVPLNPEYVTSIPYAISTLDELRERDEWTPDVRERYDILYSDIRDALANNESSRSYQELFEGLNEQVGLVMA